MSGGGGAIGPSAMAIKRSLSIGGASQRRKGGLAGASILLPHFAVYLWTFQWKKRIFFAVSKGKYTKAKYYSITKSGRKQLARETEN